jgi:hypothetical protein
VITRRIAILLLLALSGLQAAAQEPPAAGGPEASGPARALEMWLAKIAISSQTPRFSAKDLPAAGFSVRRYLPRRKENPAGRPVRREWGYFARSDVTRYGELSRLEELAPGSRFSFVPYTLSRNRDVERGPPPL